MAARHLSERLTRCSTPAAALFLLVVGACGGDDIESPATATAVSTAASAVTTAPSTKPAATAVEVLGAFRAAVAAGDRAKALDLLDDNATFAIGYEEAGKRVLTAGGPISKATWLPNLEPGPLYEDGTPTTASPATATFRYERPAPGAGVALQRGVRIVTVKDGRISSLLDYVDISDPDGLKYLTYVLGGKDPHSLPEIPAPR